MRDPGSVIVAVVGVGAIVAYGAQIASADAAAELRGLTGAHSRVVWTQDAGKGGDTFAKGNKLRLMGFDTEDGRGERVLLGKLDNYGKPLLTADGKHVVFSSGRENKVYVIGFNGEGRRGVADGFAVDVWRDPGTREDWVYVQGKRDDAKSPIHRFRLDQPKVRQLVWNRSPVRYDNFQISADGKVASGLFPWPQGGVAELPNKRWRKLGRGCWTSLSPDNSYLFWIFDGPHRNVYVHDTVRGGKWKVNLNAAPGIDGYEIYHPRWSNHVRFVSMTGPYKVGRGGNKIGGGGKAVEVHVGRFQANLRGIEKWVRVTHNKAGDFYPDVWVAGGAAASVPGDVLAAGNVAKTGVPAPKAPKDLDKHESWPGSHDGLVWVWANSNATNDVLDAEGGSVRTCMVEARGKAVFAQHYDMDLAGGAFLAQDVDKALLAACKTSSQLTVEAVLTPANLTDSGPARIVTFSSSASSRNFTLGQDEDELVFRLRTPQTGGNGVEPQVTLCRLKAGKPTHVIVSYLPGRLDGYIDGKRVLTTGDVGGDFANWEVQHLLFGDEWSDGRDWTGRLEGVSIYARAVGPKEAALKHKLYAERLKGRKLAPEIRLRAKLVNTTPTPGVEDLQDYARALVVYEYAVEKVLAGKCEHKRIAVAHWALLDRKPVERLKGFGRGKVYELTVEPFEAHEQLEAERQFNDLENFDLPLYYDPAR